MTIFMIFLLFILGFIILKIIKNGGFIFIGLLILFLMEFFQRVMGKIFIKYMKNTRNNLEIYIINFIILYLIFSIILQIFKKFLRSIKIEKYNKTFGAILGIIKSTFIIFIIYIVVLIGSNYNKKIKEQRDNSYIVEVVTEYGYAYTELFPQFIQNDVNNYRRKIKEKKLKKKILKDYKENKIEKENENENEY